MVDYMDYSFGYDTVAVGLSRDIDGLGHNYLQDLASVPYRVLKDITKVFS